MVRHFRFVDIVISKICNIWTFIYLEIIYYRCKIYKQLLTRKTLRQYINDHIWCINDMEYNTVVIYLS